MSLALIEQLTQERVDQRSEEVFGLFFRLFEEQFKKTHKRHLSIKEVCIKGEVLEDVESVSYELVAKKLDRIPDVMEDVDGFINSLSYEVEVVVRFKYGKLKRVFIFQEIHVANNTLLVFEDDSYIRMEESWD